MLRFSSCSNFAYRKNFTPHLGMSRAIRKLFTDIPFNFINLYSLIRLQCTYFVSWSMQAILTKKLLIWLDWNWNVFVLKNMCKSFLHPDKDPLFQNVSRCFQEKNRQKLCFDFSWMSHGNLKSHLVKNVHFQRHFIEKQLYCFEIESPITKQTLYRVILFFAQTSP